jgi:hypothetical protein
MAVGGSSSMNYMTSGARLYWNRVLFSGVIYGRDYSKEEAKIVSDLVIVRERQNFINPTWEWKRNRHNHKKKWE